LIAASSIRIVDRRAVSFARIAAFMSSVILAFNVIGASSWAAGAARRPQKAKGANRFAPRGVDGASPAQ